MDYRFDEKHNTFGSQTVMEKRGDAVIYLSTDQISSSSLTTDANGVEISQVRYDPYGAARWSSGTIPTDKTFTGQRSESFGLLDYNARYYSPDLGHFIQADTLIPGPGNPLAWDRYAYVQNNPLIYVDPSGQKPCVDFDEDGNCIVDPDWVPVTHFDPVNLIGRRLADDEINVLTLLMFYEYHGYSEGIPIEFGGPIYMKTWVFFNLISASTTKIIDKNPIYNGGGDMVGFWNPYVAVMGHEALLKPIFADIIPGWDPETYSGQFSALVNAINNGNYDIGNSTLKSKDFEEIKDMVATVENMWYTAGSGSMYDTTKNAISFADCNLAKSSPMDWRLATRPVRFDADQWVFSYFGW